MNQPSSLDNRRRQILEALQDRPGGATRQELQVLARLQDLDEQAVRRLLAQLVAQGAARVTGQTKARLYFLATPRSVGAPVDYQRTFLEAYQPDATRYLDQAARDRLAGPGGPWPEGRTGPARRRIMADLAWDSLRLEGGACSRAEVQRLVEGGETPAPRAPRELQMLLNHKAAVEFLLDPDQAIAVDPTTVCNLSALLNENLLADPMDEGRLRARECAVPGSAYRPPAAPGVIAADFRQILDSARGITDPFEQAFFLLVQLSYLQPFSGANGATARLAANIPLLHRRGTPLLFLEVPPELFAEGLRAVWEQNEVAPLRDLFVGACERTRERFAAEAAPARPDPVRLRYRGEIKAVVRALVLAGESAPEADRRVRAHAQSRLPGEARAGFLAAVEAELASLHDGNFARYQLRPSQFAAWKAKR